MEWLHDWWIMFRYGSPFTKAGRRLRRNLKQSDPQDYVEVHRPKED